MVQTTIDEFISYDIGGVSSDKELITYAKTKGGPATLALLNCIEDGLELKTKKGKKRSKVTVEPNNSHLIKVLWWRYKNGIINK